MEERFSPAQIGRRPLAALARWLEERGVDQAHEKASQLKKLTRTALAPDTNAVPILQSIVSKLVSLYRGLDGSINALDREVAYWLAQTPGALLTSINGIGVTLAAGWMAERGAPQEWRAVRRTCSYAGVVSKTKQTGGPDRAPLVGFAHHVAPLTERILRCEDHVQVGHAFPFRHQFFPTRPHSNRPTPLWESPRPGALSADKCFH